jgi:arylsulfatase A-like enzyme
LRIVYLDLDTLRADHLGCYGYHRDTTPNLDRIARDGMRFDQVYCSDAPCLPSRTALMSGRFGIHTGVVNHGGVASEMLPEGPDRRFRAQVNSDSLPGFLRRHGLRTVSISPFAERHSAFHFYAGFSEMYNTGKGGSESAEEVTPTVLDWLARNAETDDWFLQVNYWDAHIPYRAPDSFGNPFEGDPPPGWLTQELIDSHRTMPGQFSARETHVWDNHRFNRFPRYPGEVGDLDDFKRLIDAYDCGIAYMDSHVGRLLEALEKAGVYEETTVIVSADHGENFGELGIYADHQVVDYGTARIPMIVKWPGYKGGLAAKVGHVDKGLHYNLDLAPTLAELLGDRPMDRWDGASLAPAILRGEDCGRDYLVLSQCAHTCMRSVRFADWLYVRTYHDGYRLLPKEMLFDVAADPHEVHELAANRPEVCNQASRHLLDWHDRMMETMPHATDPLWRVMKEGGPYHARDLPPNYAARLEQTGRGEALARLRERHPGAF